MNGEVGGGGGGKRWYKRKDQKGLRLRKDPMDGWIDEGRSKAEERSSA